MANKNDAKEAVLRYLKQQNRPYSANDITQNLHKEFGKTAIQKALDDLSAAGAIKEKVYGKQKVYAPLQEDDGKQSEVDSVIQELDMKLAESGRLLAKAEQDLKGFENELKGLGVQMSTEDAVKEENELKLLVGRLTEKCDFLCKNSSNISSVDKEKVVKMRAKIDGEYRKRKRICMEIADTILENYPKSKKVFFEEVGIETDEDASR